MNQNPIGIFDSGYGGLTILKEIARILPEYDFLYLGDNARNPYGTRSFETIDQYTRECVHYLLKQDCSLIILACNTASAKALRNIQQLDLPRIAPNKRVLGVIRPTVEVLGTITSTNQVGILATKGTVSSESYLMEVNKLFPEIQVYQQACPMWVPLVENGELEGPGTNFFVQKYIDALCQQSKEIDTILLGCTHYPLLLPIIQKITAASINIVAQGPVVAPSLKDYLSRHPEIDERCSRNGQIKFLTTGNRGDFDHYGSLFFGQSIKSRKVDFSRSTSYR